MTAHNDLRVDLNQGGAFGFSDFGPIKRWRTAERAGAAAARGVRRVSARLRNLFRIETHPPRIVVRDQTRAPATGNGAVHCAPHNACRPNTQRPAGGSRQAFITLGERDPCMQTTPSWPRTPRVQRQPILSKCPRVLASKTQLPALGWRVGRINLWFTFEPCAGRSRSGRQHMDC